MTPEPLPPMKKKQGKRYALHCDFCGYHRITDGSDVNLREIPRTKVQRRTPRSENGKPVAGAFINQPKMFHCPGCGRGVVPKVCNVSIMSHDEIKNEKEDKFTRRKDGPLGQAIQGHPADGIVGGHPEVSP